MKSLTHQFNFRKILALVALVSISVSGCSFFGEKTIETSLEAKVKDPNLRRITEITSNATIDAKGVFKGGTFFINNAPVIIPPDTSFELNLVLPIDNPAVISTEKAHGTLKTSKQISVAAIPVAQVLTLEKGKVKTSVDFARSLATFMINLLQVGGHIGDMKNMVDSLEIKKVVLDLRPDSTFVLGKKSLNIDKNSTVTLVDAKVDSSMNYLGNLILSINFKPQCKWIGEKVDCEFDGGDAILRLKAEKKGNTLTLGLPEESEEKREVKMNQCLIKFGKNKRSQALSKTCILALEKFKWQDRSKGHPTMEMVAAMDLFDTDALIKTDIHHTKAHFPEKVPGRLTVNIDAGDKRLTHFETTGPSDIADGIVSIDKKNSEVDLKLANVTIGKVVYDKTGAMQFHLKGGTSNIKEISWQSMKKVFTLNCGEGSTLKVPAEFLIEKPNEDAAARVELPLALQLGTAKLSGSTGSVSLADLKGKLLLDIKDEVLIQGNLDFSLPDLEILNGHKAQVKAKGITLSVANGKSQIRLNDCALIIPDATLKATLQSHVPNSFKFTLNKKVQDEKKWRYRNATVKEVEVDNFGIKKMNAEINNEIDFTAAADVKAEGTIEKTGIILNKSKWEEKPWKLKAHVEGKGSVKYKFLKKSNNKKARVEYDLNMEVPIGKKVDLDWSQVSGGIIKVAEKNSIVDKISKTTIPIEHKGEVTLFKKNSALWKNFDIDDLTIHDRGDATEINFHAKTRL